MSLKERSPFILKALGRGLSYDFASQWQIVCYIYYLDAIAFEQIMKVVLKAIEGKLKTLSEKVVP